MRDQYIPDMTERFPEGPDGPDYTDSYFGGGSYSDEDLAWQGMEDDYNQYIQEIIDNVQHYSDEELQEIYSEQRDSFNDPDLETYKDYPEYKLLKAIEKEWDRRAAQKESAPKSHFIAWYNDSNNAEGEDQYEIYQATDLEDAINLARADIGDALLDVEPYEP